MKNAIKFKTYRNETLYLYDTMRKCVLREFKSITEIRDYIDSLLFERLYLGDHAIAMPSNLTMSLSPIMIDCFKYGADYWDEDENRYIPGFGQYQIYRYLVIIDGNFRIFNYTEIVNELKAHYYGQRITYGIGRTYKGEAYALPKYKRIYSYRTGKRRHRSSPHLIINKRERVSSFDVPDSILQDISDECDIDEKLVKKAYRSMRSNRTAYCMSDYDCEYAHRSYGSRSWKDRKQKRQWAGNKDKTRHISKAALYLNTVCREFDSEDVYEKDA